LGLDILRVDIHQLTLDLQRVWVDALELRPLLQPGRPAAADAILDLYAGDLLDGLDVRDASFEEWLDVARRELRQLVCKYLEAALAHAWTARDAEKLERAADALLALDPAHEGAHRALMRRHAAVGDLPRAVRQYQTCKTVLARDLGVLPAPETEALLQELRRRSPREIAAPEAAVTSALVARAMPNATITVEERAVARGSVGHHRGRVAGLGVARGLGPQTMAQCDRAGPRSADFGPRRPRRHDQRPVPCYRSLCPAARPGEVRSGARRVRQGSAALGRALRSRAQ
jgi:DNA-binding SARP family transcriptional activator